MIPRKASSTLKRLARGFPVIAITGPRQSGKTTLARHIFAAHPYVSLENPDTRAFALTDPKRFLAQFQNGVIIDEVQRAPELFSWLQGWVDERQIMGDIIVTGSAQFELNQQISQTLAGRVGRVELMPLSGSELADSQTLPASLDDFLIKGGYPALYSRELSPADWFSNYVSTYIERDVRNLLNIKNLEAFQRFLKLLALRSGQLLNLNSVSADCGISSVTAKSWLTIIEASYLVVRLPPYFANIGKRLVKTPKLYFLDTGLLCWLLGVHATEALLSHPLRGNIFETLIVSDAYKQHWNQGKTAPLFFWRDNVGLEIDLLRETNNHWDAYEIKSGTTFSSDWFSSLKRVQALDSTLANISVIYGGEESSSRSLGEVLAWRRSFTAFTAAD